MTDAPRIARSSFGLRATGPLDGVWVIGMSRLVAGNIVTHALPDFGADVIKVERPGSAMAAAPAGYR
jgi:crotonobetainyl-CoA:carnitine CoA-transferase CaiB-like acyl-CoA transferase